MRRAVRTLGNLLILAGIGLLLWAFAVWRWEDPFTGLYTRYEQHQLEEEYEELFAGFRVVPTAKRPSLAATAQRLAVAARRYRASSQRGDAIARLRVPRLALDAIVVNGTDTRSLKKGPGRYIGTFMPGEGQLVYVAGHRTTYGAPFSEIDRLRAGDRITVELPYATFTYAVTRHVIVRSTQLSVLQSRGRELLALQACHPRFFASHRYIAYARPTRVTLRDGTAYSASTLAALGTT
jgi:sortase A